MEEPWAVSLLPGLREVRICPSSVGQGAAPGAGRPKLGFSLPHIPLYLLPAAWLPKAFWESDPAGNGLFILPTEPQSGMWGWREEKHRGWCSLSREV